MSEHLAKISLPPYEVKEFTRHPQYPNRRCEINQDQGDPSGRFNAFTNSTS